MTPVELVLSKYGLPFTLYKYQVETVDELAPLPKSGHYLAVGVGKTATSTVSALYKFVVGEADKVIVLAPPILLTAWYRWLTSISGTSAMIYRGSPKERKLMRFDSDFTLMTYNIFKGDQDRLLRDFSTDRTVLICDEATAIKNFSSQNYKTVRDFSMDGFLMLLTGTPLAKVTDGYSYVKLLAPAIYRNKNQFDNVHIDKTDFWGTPLTYKNLDILEKNMKINSVRLLKEDVLKDLPDITYTPLHYDLAPAHLALYLKLAEEQLLEFDDGSKLDATETTALWHALQQIVCNFDYFSDNPDNTSAAFELIDQTMDELAGRKLIIFTNYRLTSRAVTKHCLKYGGVAVYGEITAKQQQKNVDRFMNDPTCLTLVAQVQSAGYGLNFQDCCADALFLEAPLSPIQFEQAVGRVYRNGQKMLVHIRVAIAQGTIQVHLSNLLMKKDKLINKVIRNFKDIQNALYGI